MPLFRSRKKRSKKKKSISKKDILKVIENKEFVDLGTPFGESARRYLAYKLSQMIDDREVQGSVITPEGVYVSMSATTIRDIVKLIKAKGICNLKKIARQNKWHLRSVKLIAQNRINTYDRTDKTIITQRTAKDLLQQQLIQEEETTIEELADTLKLPEEVIGNLLKSIMQEEEINGIYLPEAKKIITVENIKKSFKDKIEKSEEEGKEELSFEEISGEYNLPNEQIYEYLQDLQQQGEIDIRINLGKRICILRSNVELIFQERIPEEEKKLEIEDLTKKNEKQ
jgi:hypothetical protein